MYKKGFLPSGVYTRSSAHFSIQYTHFSAHSYLCSPVMFIHVPLRVKFVDTYVHKIHKRYHHSIIHTLCSQAFTPIRSLPKLKFGHKQL